MCPNSDFTRLLMNPKSCNGLISEHSRAPQHRQHRQHCQRAPINVLQRKAAKSRPPPIPIAPKEQPRSQHSSSSSTETYGGMSPPAKNSRLPPRSRNGCWTCRTRKVKCDEQHPRCGQCLRLQHECDYSPRLSFRDDTVRIRERMQEVCIQGSGVWDSNEPFDYIHNDITLDILREAQALPQFPLLVCDEERELKALLEKPGKYNVICNQDSFSNLDTDDNDYIKDIKMENVLEDDTIWNSTYFDLGGLVEDEEGMFDSEIVILKRFEESTLPRIALSNSREKTSLSPTPSGDSYSISSSADETGARQVVSNYDLRYYAEYQRATSLHLRQICLFSGVWSNPNIVPHVPDMFEVESKKFPPLYHAMLSLAAFSNKHVGSYNTYALQHYQHALPKINSAVHYPNLLARDCHINSPADLGTDGIFFTHALLLIFEITAAENWRESLWQSHLDQLTQIITTKIEIEGKEIHPSIIWFLVVVDAYAALGSGGKGELAGVLAANNLIPEASLLIPYNLTTGRDGISEFERDSLIAITRAHQRIVLYAVKLANISKLFHCEDETLGSPNHQNLRLRNGQVQEILSEMKNLLRYNIFNVMTSFDSRGNSCSMMHDIYYQTNALVQACIIFGRTSMYTHQVTHLTTDDKKDIENAIGRIIGQAKRVPCYDKAPSYEHKSELSFMLFPLFLAGVMTASANEKDWIMDYLKDRELDYLGLNVRSVNNLLQGITSRQNGTFLVNLAGPPETANPGEVNWAEADWKTFMKTQEHQVIFFAL